MFRLTREDNLHEALVQHIGTFNHGLPMPQLYQVYPAEVCILPGRPFSYWLSSTLRRKISALPQLEGSGRTVKQGTVTADEGRFSRAWWEVPATAEGWLPYTKTSAYSPFWDDITWVGNFGQGLKEILATGKARVQGTDYFSRPGVTYPSKAVLGFNPRLQPSGCGFGHTGSVVFAENVDPLALLGFLGSRPVEYLLSLFIGELQGKAGVHPNHYEVGTIQRLPWPGLTAETVGALERSAAACVTAVVGLQSQDEPTRSFMSPLLAPQSGIRHNAKLAAHNERAALQEICQTETPLMISSLIRSDLRKVIGWNWKPHFLTAFRHPRVNGECILDRPVLTSPSSSMRKGAHHGFSASPWEDGSWYQVPADASPLLTN